MVVLIMYCMQALQTGQVTTRKGVAEEVYPVPFVI